MWEIIGHEATLSALDRLAAAERLAHAYLLVGPVSVGKTTVATWLAARLLCTQASGVRRQRSVAPCGTCDACGAVARGVHPDVLRLMGEDVRTVDRVREWTSSLARSSLFAGWKIGIVEGAEQMNEASANACLKSIEEPTPKTVILLTAPNRRAVLPTIASRCALMTCHRVRAATLTHALQDRGVHDPDAEAITVIADGCPGTALRLVGQPEQRAAQEQRRALAHEMLSGTSRARLQHVESFVRALPDDRNAMVEQSMELVRGFRAIAQTMTGECRARADWVRWQQLLVRAPQYLAANVTPRLLLETVVLTHPTV
ncbi:MAG: hypothetical protein Q7S02_00505 [bacterium]|nr:hypothetical protein [bacterium]